jgi:hypothetical protein
MTEPSVVSLLPSQRCTVHESVTEVQRVRFSGFSLTLADGKRGGLSHIEQTRGLRRESDALA